MKSPPHILTFTLLFMFNIYAKNGGENIYIAFITMLQGKLKKNGGNSRSLIDPDLILS